MKQAILLSFIFISSYLNGQIENREWTTKRLNTFYANFVKKCPKIAFWGQTRNGEVKDYLEVYFNSLNNEEADQLRITAQYEIKNFGISKSDFIRDFNITYCKVSWDYISENFVMIQCIMKYRRKFQLDTN